jgi:chemotaxis signal transduction protein
MTPAGSSTAISDTAQGNIDRCWTRIGIQGDRSCPELARHSHCRNCPVFSLAAGKLLDRDLPESMETGLISQIGSSADRHETEIESVIIFRVGNEWFALPTQVLDEVVGLRPIHSLPHRRHPALLGIVNVRGDLVACLSIAQLLIGSSQSAAPSRLIVVRDAGGRLAFPVDEVQHTHHYSLGDLARAPETVARSASRFTKGLFSWRDKSVGRLDDRSLFEALNRCLT